MQNQESVGSASVVSGLPFAEAVAGGHLVFISGQIGVDGGDKPFGEEVSQVMRNLGGVLQRQKLGYIDLVQVTIYLTEMSNYGETNRIYSGYFQGEYPARVCIAVKELPLG